MMEDLIELVAASFARHGIECPAADSSFARPTKPSLSVRLDDPTLTDFPEHNYRKSLQGDPAP